MATSTSGLGFSGLFSGLDTESIISQLVYLDSAPIRQLQAQKAKLDYQKTDLNSVNTSLLALKSTIKDFVNGVLLQNKATSSDENSVTASADTSATPGTYTVSIANMAAAHRVSTSEMPGVYAGPADTFGITIAGKTYNINVATGDSMAVIASKINNSTSGGTAFNTVGQATVITNPATGGKTLVIESLNTGVANAMTFTDGATNILQPTGTNPNGLGILNGAVLNHELQAAVDASLTINGVPVSSATNTITGAITGVTLTIEKNFGGADIVVGTDTASFVSKVQAFVDQFNKSTDLLSGFISEESVDGAETDADKAKGVLQGDVDLSMAKSSIRMRTTGYLDLTQATYKILADIGIESEASVGSLVSDNITLDSSKLTQALNDDKDQVANLLQGFANQLDSYLDSQTHVSTIQSLAGNFYGRILSIDEQKSSIDEDIANWEDRISAIEDRYRTQFSTMESFLQQLQSQSSYLTQQLNSLNNTSSSSKKS